MSWSRQKERGWRRRRRTLPPRLCLDLLRRPRVVRRHPVVLEAVALFCFCCLFRACLCVCVQRRYGCRRRLLRVGIVAGGGALQDPGGARAKGQGRRRHGGALKTGTRRAPSQTAARAKRLARARPSRRGRQRGRPGRACGGCCRLFSCCWCVVLALFMLGVVVDVRCCSCEGVAVGVGSCCPRHSVLRAKPEAAPLSPRTPAAVAAAADLRPPPHRMFWYGRPASSTNASLMASSTSRPSPTAPKIVLFSSKEGHSAPRVM